MLQNRELERGANSVCIADASQSIDRVYNIQSRPEASGQSEQCLLTLRESSFIKKNSRDANYYGNEQIKLCGTFVTGAS